jgi:two-component system, NtrC family, sensor histidine kinase HydH
MLMAEVLKKLNRGSSLLAPDFPSFKRQESIFVILNLSVLAALLLIHTLFSGVFGTPPLLFLVVLSAGFLLNVIELIWVQGVAYLSPAGMAALTWWSIGLNMALAFSLASLSFRQDTQYFALLVAPVLEAAFRFSLGATIAVVVASAGLNLFWVWNYFRLHPPAAINEYIEMGTVSLIYAIVGILVWILVNHLRAKEAELTASLSDLEKAKERLLMEEKLAAVGRFSSAIAHEIRNPVAMISSALATAANPGLNPSDRQQMFDIAGKEAKRLEKLTGDFLTYARPRPPTKHPGNVSESVAYVIDICRPHATAAGVSITADLAPALLADIDTGQVQQAVLNLVMNAIEASPAGCTVTVRAGQIGRWVAIQIENPSGPIPNEAADHIFEPFFTTKPSGTGLGLAIARSVARAHGGDVVLSQNDPDVVQFTLKLPASTEGTASE